MSKTASSMRRLKSKRYEYDHDEIASHKSNEIQNGGKLTYPPLHRTDDDMFSPPRRLLAETADADVSVEEGPSLAALLVLAADTARPTGSVAARSAPTVISV